MENKWDWAKERSENNFEYLRVAFCWADTAEGTGYVTLERPVRGK